MSNKKNPDALIKERMKLLERIKEIDNELKTTFQPMKLELDLVDLAGKKEEIKTACIGLSDKKPSQLYIQLLPNVKVFFPEKCFKNSEKVKTIRCNRGSECRYSGCGYAHPGEIYNRIFINAECPSNPTFDGINDVDKITDLDIRMMLYYGLSNIYRCLEKLKSCPPGTVINGLDYCKQ